MLEKLELLFFRDVPSYLRFDRRTHTVPAVHAVANGGRAVSPGTCAVGLACPVATQTTSSDPAHLRRRCLYRRHQQRNCVLDAIGQTRTFTSGTAVDKFNEQPRSRGAIMSLDPVIRIVSIAHNSFATVSAFVCDRIGKQRPSKTLDCIDAFSRHRPTAHRMQAPHLRQIGVAVEKNLRPLVLPNTLLPSEAIAKT